MRTARPTIVALVAALAAGSASATAATRSFPVPKTIIYPGDTLTSEVIEERSLVVKPGIEYPVFASAGKLVGRVARRTLLPGQAIPFTAVRDPHLVVQGQSTRVLFEMGSLTILTHAIALQSGSENEAITLRNAETGIVIKGLVQADGSVRVGGR